MTTRTSHLLTKASALNKHKLTNNQIGSLLEEAQCTTYRIETRLYISSDAEHLISKLLEFRLSGTTTQRHINSLKRKTVLYRCTHCGALRFSPELLLSEQQLTHQCSLDLLDTSTSGRFKLIGSDSLRSLLTQHRALLHLEEPALKLAS